MSDIPQSLTVPIELKALGRGVYKMEEFVSGIINTRHGQTEAGLLLNATLPGEEPEPVRFITKLRTREHPMGVTLAIELTDLLEAFAEAYFAQAPTDRPLAPGDEPPRPPLSLVE